VKKFRVKVNGAEYEVEIEEIGVQSTSAPQRLVETTLIEPLPAQVIEAVGSSRNYLRDDAGSIRSPMPGVIIQIRVQIGEQVEAGTVLFILEAMKMENMIKADIAGVVTEVRVAEGQAVNSGDTLAIIA